MNSPPKDTIQRWSGERGGAYIELREGRVLVVSMEGHVDASMGARVAEVLDKQLNRGAGFWTFWDLQRLQSYESETRLGFTRVLLGHRDGIVAIQVFAPSKVVRMGFAIANVALGGRIKIHDERGSFLSALGAAERLASRLEFQECLPPIGRRWAGG
jgi:hypothetical protein